MTMFEALEGELPVLLEELAAPRVPDYLDAVYGRTSKAPQRRSWTFPGRWIPTSRIAGGAVGLPRSEVRAVALGILLLLVALVAGALVAGSQPRPAPSFGPARNGLVAYAADGDILAIDPLTGTSRPIAVGPRLDSSPLFSPDGTRIAFKRLQAGSPIDSYEIVVADADGSNPRTVATLPIAYWSDFDAFQWTPDGRSLLVNMQESGELVLHDLDGGARPRVVASSVTNVDFQPPAGDRLLFRRLDMSGTGLYTMRLDGSDVRELVRIPLGYARSDEDLAGARWSADGSMIAFVRASAGGSGGLGLFLMRADGTGIRSLPMGAGTSSARGPVWSPDGTRLAFARWDDAGNAQRIGVLTVASGTVTEVGPLPGENGISFDWSPDGTTILALPVDDPRLIAIDPRDGSWRTLASAIRADGSPAWQRLAP